MKLPNWLPAILIILSGVVAYSNVSRVPLIFDDTVSLQDNKTIRSLSVETLSPPPETTVAGRPFSNFSFALNYAFSGLALPPLHWTNVALHIAAALLMMALIHRTLLLPRFGGRYRRSAEPLALLGAMLWLLHPVQTESVTYVVQRVESLAGLMLMLLLYAGLRAYESRSFAWMALAILASGLGMASKETMAVAPIILLMYDRAYLFDSYVEAFRERWSLYAGVAATWGVLALQVATNPRRVSAGFHFAGFRPVDYLGIQLGAILHYMRLLVWPTGLIFDYGEPGGSIPLVKSFAEWGPRAAVLLVILGLSLRIWFRRPWFGFLPLSFFILLAPSSSIVPITTEVISEHRLYLPSAAAILLLVFAAHEVVVRFGGLRAIATGFSAAIVLLCALLTYRRNEVYRSDVSLWTDTVQKWPQNPRAWSALGDSYRLSHDIPRAEAAYKEALDRDSLVVGALKGMGLIEADRGNVDAAIGYYERFLAWRPKFSGIHVNLGHLLEMKGRLDEARQHYEKALEIVPEDGVVHGDLANCLAKMGRLDEAAQEYALSLELEPSWALGRYNIGTFFVRTHQYDKALASFREALKLDPKMTVAWYRAGLVASWTGQSSEAVADLEKALDLDSGRTDVMDDLAWLLATYPDSQTRNGARALALATQALAASTETSRALDVLAAAQAEAGQYEAARASAARSLQLAQQKHGSNTEAIRQRLTLYEGGRPYREQPRLK